MTHELKCWPEYFRPLWKRAKSFEIRLNDRNFQVGDTLRLREWNPDTKYYTGLVIEREVIYVTDFPTGLREGYVCMGLK